MTCRAVLLAGALAVLAACSSAPGLSGAGTVAAPEPTSASPATTSVATSTSTSVAPGTVAPTTVPASTVPPSTSTALFAHAADFLGEEVIGTSYDGRPITAMHRGTAGGTVILVVGVILGDEDDGLLIVGDLEEMPLPAGYDLWLLPEMNPDGVARQIRGNGHGVDLNRNFPHDWTAIATEGDWQWSGPGPGSEPETQAYMAFTTRIRPALTIWYHQDLFRVSPSKGPDGPLRRRYAELTGLPYETVSGPGSIYTGVAATWTRTQLPNAMSFIVELGPTLSAEEAQVHAAAVLAVAQMV